MKSRGQPAVAPELGINADAEPPPPMRVREGSRERPTAERHTLGRGDHSPNTALERSEGDTLSLPPRFNLFIRAVGDTSRPPSAVTRS